jgi:hypothetical protein
LQRKLRTCIRIETNKTYYQYDFFVLSGCVS